MLVFTADSGYRNELLYGRSDIWTVTPAGALRKLTSNKDYSYANASFSPDGQWILATRSTPTDAVIAKKMDNGGPVDLVLVPASGGTEVNLTAAGTTCLPARSGARMVSSSISPGALAGRHTSSASRQRRSKSSR